MIRIYNFLLSIILLLLSSSRLVKSYNVSATVLISSLIESSTYIEDENDMTINTIKRNTDNNEQQRLLQQREEPTFSPTVTTTPTYSEKCYVCGGADDMFVSCPNTTYTDFFGKDVPCGALEILGKSGQLPPEVCSVVQSSVNSTCTCTGTPPNIPDIDNPDCPSIPTQSPTITVTATTMIPTPFVSSPLLPTTPSISLKPSNDNNSTSVCYVCDDENLYIQYPNNNVTIPSMNYTANCQTLDEIGRDGQLQSDICIAIISFVKVQCGCSTTRAPTISPTIIDDPPIQSPTTRPVSSSSSIIINTVSLKSHIGIFITIMITSSFV